MSRGTSDPTSAAYDRHLEREEDAGRAWWTKTLLARNASWQSLDIVLGIRRDFLNCESRGDFEAMLERCRRDEYGPLSDWIADEVLYPILRED